MSSNLRAAPAIGAAIDAFRYYKLKTEDTDKIKLNNK
jgi:mevalonate kinase